MHLFVYEYKLNNQNAVYSTCHSCATVLYGNFFFINKNRFRIVRGDDSFVQQHHQKYNKIQRDNNQLKNSTDWVK